MRPSEMRPSDMSLYTQKAHPFLCKTSKSLLNMVNLCLGIPSRFLFFILCLLGAHHIASSALPAGPQLGANINFNSITTPNPAHVSRVEHIITNLLRWTETQPNIRYPEASLILVEMRVNRPSQADPTMSSNFQDFRYIQCTFRYRGPPSPPWGSEILTFENRWPQHWEQWDFTPRVSSDRMDVEEVDHLRAFNFDAAVRRMSGEWADQLLKSQGYRGRYGHVYLVQSGGWPLGWCFDEYERGLDELIAVSVVIATGEVTEVETCLFRD